MTDETSLIAADNLEVTLALGDNVATLERDWLRLQPLSRGSVFQTWHWVGPLLRSVGPDEQPQVMRIYSDKRLVAIGLLWQRVQRRHGFVWSRGLHLNETGRAELDRVTLEHNGLLCVSGLETATANAALVFLSGRRDWDELFLPALPDESCGTEAWSAAALHSRLSFRRRWTHPYYWVDLDAVRRGTGAYLDALSANTRYQARRAMKSYAARGALAFECAESVAQAQEWLSELQRLHQAQWEARGQQGAFGTQFQRRFHAAVVEQGFASGSAIICRARAGSEVLGFLYNFRHLDKIHNYQSGHVAESDPKLKPGLVMHCLAVEDALRRGLRCYDLLVGGDHFKPSLTNARETMSWCVVQQPRLSLRVEEWLRRARDRRRKIRRAVDLPQDAPERE